jgi:uncharacterized protein
MAASGTFLVRSRIPVPAETVLEWHLRPGAFQRLTPPWEPVELVSMTGPIRDNSRAELRIGAGPFRQRWIAEHRYVEGELQFQDVQISGPFALWEHTHKMEPDGPDACYLEDRIEYRLPFGAAGRLLGERFLRRKLTRMFEYRHRITRADLLVHQQRKAQTPMQIAITGSTGLVGSHLTSFLTTGGHEVVPLVRSEPSPDRREIRWDPEGGAIDTAALEGLDAVVHLAGENIATGRWTEDKKQRIRHSRVNGTRVLSQALTGLQNPPKVLVSASAIGYYGDRGDEMLDEHSGPGSFFLSEVCREWEEATGPAREKGIRVVNLRIGVVLSPKGGALGKMLPPFRMGAGGVVGSGKQWMSWIVLDDLVTAIHFAITHENLQGPVNVVSPNPVTSREFTKTLGKVLGRPTLVPMPAFAAKLALGQMADELLLASARIFPKELQQAGFEFAYPDLESGLRHLLGKT